MPLGTRERLSRAARADCREKGGIVRATAFARKKTAPPTAFPPRTHRLLTTYGADASLTLNPWRMPQVLPFAELTSLRAAPGGYHPSMPLLAQLLSLASVQSTSANHGANGTSTSKVTQLSKRRAQPHRRLGRDSPCAGVAISEVYSRSLGGPFLSRSPSCPPDLT